MSAGNGRSESVRRNLLLLQFVGTFAGIIILGFLLLLQRQEAATLERVHDYHLRSQALCEQIVAEAVEIETLVASARGLQPTSARAATIEGTVRLSLVTRTETATQLIAEAVDELEAIQERFGGLEAEGTLLRLGQAVHPPLTGAGGVLPPDLVEQPKIRSVLVASKQLALLHVVARGEYLEEAERVRQRAVILGGLLLSALLAMAVLYSQRLRAAVRRILNEQLRVNEALEANRKQLEDLIALRSTELEEVRRSRELHRRLAGRLQSAREEERAQIARELHDEFGQALTGVKLDISWLLSKRSSGDQEPWFSERLRAILQILDQSQAYVRELTWRLRPPLLDDLGLAAALEWQVSEFERQSGCETELTIAVPDLEPDEHRDVAVFRILQETLTNVMRHASASNVNVSLRAEDGELVLEIRDDGIGLGSDPFSNAGSSGLHGMAERAQALGGKIEFLRPERGGTLIKLAMPYSLPPGASVLKT